MVKISIITPTIGRNSLSDMFSAVRPQMGPDDEIIVIGDGPQSNARRIVEETKDPRLIYLEYGPIRNYGNPQRNMAIKMASGDYIFFVDDDDLPLPGCMDAIRTAASEFPGRPLMFKMHHGPHIIWTEKGLIGGNISGQMFVPPNRKQFLGVWSGRYAADFDFISSTVAKYPEKENAIVWRSEITVRQGYAGPSKDAVEL